MGIEINTPDRVNEKVTYFGMSPLVVLFGGVGIGILLFVLTNYFGLLGFLFFVPISMLITKVGKKYKDRYKQGEYNHATKVFEYASSKKVIVDKDGILEEM